jgi:hypothetical protein
MLTDPGTLPPVPPPVIAWVGREVAGRRIGRYPVSALELAGQWALAAVPSASSSSSASASGARIRYASVTSSARRSASTSAARGITSGQPSQPGVVKKTSGCPHPQTS